MPEWEDVARAAGEPRSWVPEQWAARAQGSFVVGYLGSLLLLVAGVVVLLPWLGVLGWVLGAVTDWLATRGDQPIVRLVDLVGVRAWVRALQRSFLALLLLAGVAGVPLALIVGYALVVIAVQLVWHLLVVLATWLARSQPPLLYRPRAEHQPHPFAGYAQAYGRAVGTPGLFVAVEFAALVVATAAATGVLAPLVGAVGMGLAVVIVLGQAASCVLQARALSASSGADERELLEQVSSAAPCYLVYVSLGAGQARYIVNQWGPVLDALTVKGLMVVREASQLGPIGPTALPVVYAPSSRHVERLTVPSVKVAFYLAYGEKNGTLMRDASIKHVMLMHGDSDKSTSANPLARGFDEVWVAGQAGADRYAAAGIDIPPERFAFVGRPQVQPLRVGPRGTLPRTVFYAPTFEGYYDHTSHTSLDTMGVELVRRILAEFPGVQVWFKPHPASGVQRPAMLAAIDSIGQLLRESAAAGHVVVDERPALTLVDCLQATDVLITDISSVATDFLYTERPIITTNPAGLSDDEFMARYPTQRGCYLLDPALAGLHGILTDALGEDSLRDARLAMKRYVLGDFPLGPQAAFSNEVARITST